MNILFYLLGNSFGFQNQVVNFPESLLRKSSFYINVRFIFYKNGFWNVGIKTPAHIQNTILFKTKFSASELRNGMIAPFPTALIVVKLRCGCCQQNKNGRTDYRSFSKIYKPSWFNFNLRKFWKREALPYENSPDFQRSGAERSEH